MSSLCRGNLKIRGEKEDIINFLKEGLDPFCIVVPAVDLKVHEEDIRTVLKSTDCFHISETTHAFIEQSEIMYRHSCNILVVEFCQANRIISKELAPISKKFNLDFKIYGFSSGNQFNQDIEIHKGVIIKDLHITFDNYKWDCIFPELGH